MCEFEREAVGRKEGGADFGFGRDEQVGGEDLLLGRTGMGSG
jgi:hypothetical protein